MADDSLLIALAELKDIETERVAKEDADAKRVIREAAEAEAQKAAFEAAQEEERRAVAEAKARLAFAAESEASAEAAASKARLDALQAELQTIQAERRMLHERVLLASTPQPPAPSRSIWPVAFAASTALAMALGAWLFVRGPEVQVREVMVPVAAPVASLEPAASAPAIEEAAPEVEEVVAAPAPETRPRVRTRPRGPRPAVRTPSMDLAGLDECDDNDPLCGL